jgi:hypothetical protein
MVHLVLQLQPMACSNPTVSAPSDGTVSVMVVQDLKQENGQQEMLVVTLSTASRTVSWTR